MNRRRLLSLSLGVALMSAVASAQEPDQVSAEPVKARVSSDNGAREERLSSEAAGESEFTEQFEVSCEGDECEVGEVAGDSAEGEDGDESTEEDDEGDHVQPMGLPGSADKSGVTSQVISIPKAEGTIKGMEESFSAQLSTGIATFTVPISLLPARGGAQPQLGLSYRSSGGFGVAGVGWDIGVAFIARQTDRGIPSYNDGGTFHPGQDRFVFNGGQELVPICDVTGAGDCVDRAGRPVQLPDGERMPDWAANWMYFRARVEGSFLRFFWHPNRKTWRVQDKSGVTMELGVPLDGSGYDDALEANPDEPSEVYRWCLSRKYDTYGERDGEGNLTPVNAVYYRYDKRPQDGGRTYLSDIYDTSPASDPTTRVFSQFAHHTRLRYKERTDPTSGYRSGWRIDQTRRLVGIDVTSKTFNGGEGGKRALVRRYHLAYDAAYHASLLESVTVEGRCAGSETQAPTEVAGRLQATNCPTLPSMRFAYSHAGASADPDGFERFSTEISEAWNSPAHSVDNDQADLFDIDSDGLPDLLLTEPGRYGDGHAVFFNSPSGQPDSFGEPELMGVRGVSDATPGTLTLRNANIAPLDVDGDGRVNLVHMPRLNRYSIYEPRKEGNEWLWVGREIETADGQDSKIDFGRDTISTAVADVNFDGLVDVVVSTGTELQTFFSLGRHRGGDGQFGQVQYLPDGAVVLSNEPVRHCLPHAGLPIDLSDQEVRLSDMNGDSIVDIVRLQAGQIRYWPGRGNGFFGTDAARGCAPGAFSEGYVEMEDSPWLAAWAGAEFRSADVNGDGLADLVHVGSGVVSIWQNIDGRAWAERRVIENTPAAPGFRSRVRIVDVNGSGTRDILWGSGGKYQYIDLQGGGQSRLLTSVDNGLGKTSTLEYEPSTRQMLRAERGEDSFGTGWADKMPLVTQVVRRRIERDNLGTVAGLPKREYVTEYTYRDPFYDGRQREFRGFAYAETKRIGDANSPTSITASSFLLGKCVDEQTGDGVDACSVEERWRDNPREALKGLPVISETFDETGTYLSTAHSGYLLRRLYLGLDGRDVRHAFLETSTTHLYDTAPFVSAEGVTDSTQTVRLESERDVIADGSGPEDRSEVPLRSTSRMARLRGSAGVDWFGNQTSATNEGCTRGGACAVPDEIIVRSFVPTPLPGPSGWLWRTTETSAHGEASRGIGHGTRSHALTAFDEHGAAINTTAVLAGTLGLDRFHAANEPTASAPASASADRTLLLSRNHYDGTFGNVTLTRGANGRCAAVSYDEPYALFATSETIYPGGCGSLTSQDQPNIPGDAVALNMASAYDHGLGAPTVIVNMQGQYSFVRYDGFGRLTELYRPHPGVAFDRSAPVASPDDTETSAPFGVCKLPSVVIEYALPDETHQAYSRIHTKTQDGTSCGEGDGDDDGYAHAYAILDGFGRTLVAMAEADSDASQGDGHPWVAGGVVEYDAKAAVRRKFLPFYYDEEPEDYDPTDPPNAQYGSQRYDAFGRAVQTYDVDGTVTLTTRYHALSTDLWDAADIGPGPHTGSYASAKKDGHGRDVLSTERFHKGGSLEERHVETTYLPTNEVSVIARYKGGATNERVTRWMRYDSLGRMVLNVDPNTTVDFTDDSNTDVSAARMKAWRYAYNDAGDLVGTSDARGCGVNFAYDGAGRLLSEDYSPCDPHHADYSDPETEGLEGAEVIYSYDTSAAPAGLEAPPTLTVVSEGFYAGQLAAVWDRGAIRYTSYDGRGRAIEVHAQIAAPKSQTTGTLADRYAPRWYKREVRYDAADREVWSTTGAQHPELMGIPTAPGQGMTGGPMSASAVTTSYTRRGKTKNVGGSYKSLVQSVQRTADDLVTRIVYGDIASTATDFSYDFRRRLMTVQTYRGPPTEWSDPNSYTPSPALGAAPSTFQLLLQDQEYDYDVVNNPTEITDYRIPDEWPESAKPVTRKMQYDDLYRVERVDYECAAGDDVWKSPFDAENNAANDDDLDPRRAKPSPHVRFDKRTLWQTFEYDWLGNNNITKDDANGFYDRSLGEIENGEPTGVAYRMLGATSEDPRAPGTDWLDVEYDACGSMRAVTVSRGGDCLGGDCSQHYVYEWDEVGRLSRARRWDTDPLGATALAAAASDPNSAADVYAGLADVELDYIYDGSDQRVVKTATDVEGNESHTVYIFNSLELRRAQYKPTQTGSAPDYELTALTEVAYLFANGVRLARAVFEPIAAAVPSLDDGDAETIYGRGSKLHVFFELGDHLGSSSLVLDQQTGELVEATTYQAYGATESDYRPDRWANFREDYRFTGKEDDVEVGLHYFGKRYLNPLLGRWVSADPLAVHVPGEAGLNLYAYVSGRVLQAIDPVGLLEANVGQGAGGAGPGASTPAPSSIDQGAHGTDSGPSAEPGASNESAWHPPPPPLAGDQIGPPAPPGATAAAGPGVAAPGVAAPAVAAPGVAESSTLSVTDSNLREPDETLAVTETWSFGDDQKTDDFDYSNWGQVPTFSMTQKYGNRGFIQGYQEDATVELATYSGSAGWAGAGGRVSAGRFTLHRSADSGFTGAIDGTFLDASGGLGHGGYNPKTDTHTARVGGSLSGIKAGARGGWGRWQLRLGLSYGSIGLQGTATVNRDQTTVCFAGAVMLGVSLCGGFPSPRH